MEKILITPGKLYATMAAEFRRLRPSACQSCYMPMLYVTENRREGEGANWLVEEGSTGCGECRGLIADIVRRFSSQFDVFDPAFTTRFPIGDGVSRSSLFRI